MGEWKTAWDHIVFEGFLGIRMKLQFTWEGCDSALAAPLLLDLAASPRWPWPRRDRPPGRARLLLQAADRLAGAPTRAAVGRPARLVDGVRRPGDDVRVADLVELTRRTPPRSPSRGRVVRCRARGDRRAGLGDADRLHLPLLVRDGLQRLVRPARRRRGAARAPDPLGPGQPRRRSCRRRRAGCRRPRRGRPRRRSLGCRGRGSARPDGGGLRRSREGRGRRAARDGLHTGTRRPPRRPRLAGQRVAARSGDDRAHRGSHLAQPRGGARHPTRGRRSGHRRHPRRGRRHGPRGVPRPARRSPGPNGRRRPVGGVRRRGRPRAGPRGRSSPRPRRPAPPPAPGSAGSRSRSRPGCPPGPARSPRVRRGRRPAPTAPSRGAGARRERPGAGRPAPRLRHQRPLRPPARRRARAARRARLRRRRADARPHPLRPASPRRGAPRPRGRAKCSTTRVWPCVVETGARFVLDPRRKHFPTLVSDGRQRRVDLLCAAVASPPSSARRSCRCWSGVPPDGPPPTTAGDLLVDGCERVLDRPRARRHARFEPEPGMLVDTLDEPSSCAAGSATPTASG